MGGDMYTVEKVSTSPPSDTTFDTEDRFTITLNKIVNWDGSATMSTDFTSPNTEFTLGKIAVASESGLPVYGITKPKKVGVQRIVKFEPGTSGNYEYVQQCSGRGLCDSESGLCQCFPGYTNDNCDTQS